VLLLKRRVLLHLLLLLLVLLLLLSPLLLQALLLLLLMLLLLILLLLLLLLLLMPLLLLQLGARRGGVDRRVRRHGLLLLLQLVPLGRHNLPQHVVLVLCQDHPAGSSALLELFHLRVCYPCDCRRSPRRRGARGPVANRRGTHRWCGMRQPPHCRRVTTTRGTR